MQNFYDVCAKSDLQKIVYLGGAIALRNAPDGEMGHADMEYDGEPQNKNPYLQVKWAMDRLAKAEAAKGLPVVIGIPSMTIGEHDYGPTTGQLLMEVANGTLPGYISGNRNTIYAGDAGRGLVLACEKGVVGERYLFCGENVSMEDLVAMIARVSGGDMPKEVPLVAAKFLGKLQGLKYKVFGGDLPKISETAIAVMSAGQFLDGSKAEKELGFKADVSLEEAIKRSLNWFAKVGYINQ